MLPVALPSTALVPLAVMLPTGELLLYPNPMGSVRAGVPLAVMLPAEGDPLAVTLPTGD